MLNLNILPIYLDEDVFFDPKYYENTAVVDLKDFHIKGVIKYNLGDEIEIDLHVTGKMYLVDAITLERVIYPIDLKIQENLSETGDESAKYYEKSKNTLDKLEFLWENIVLEVPISFTSSPGVSMSGDGWELNGGYDEEDKNTPLAKLNDLFKGGE